jgi:ribonuclease HI
VNKSLELRCRDWKSRAYTDESCQKKENGGKTTQYIGAGVYHPDFKTECYVHFGGIGLTNTINRAELTGIAATLLKQYTNIATDSACCLSQIRKQLLFPELQRMHNHSKLLDQIVSIIQTCPEPIHFYKVKAHAGIAGNECADAIAKHAAMHESGHDTTFAPVSLNGNPYTNIYWLEAEERSLGTAGNEVIRLSALSNLKDNLKHNMQKLHRLGGANIDTGCCTY